MFWLFAALAIALAVLPAAQSQGCRCSVSGPPPPNMTQADIYPVYFNDNGQIKTCYNGDQYVMPRAYPHAQVCKACVATTCSCCRNSDGDWMRGYNPNQPRIYPEHIPYVLTDQDILGLSAGFGTLAGLCVCCCCIQLCQVDRPKSQPRPINV